MVMHRMRPANAFMLLPICTSRSVASAMLQNTMPYSVQRTHRLRMSRQNGVSFCWTAAMRPRPAKMSGRMTERFFAHRNQSSPGMLTIHSGTVTSDTTHTHIDAR